MQQLWYINQAKTIIISCVSQPQKCWEPTSIYWLLHCNLFCTMLFLKWVLHFLCVSAVDLWWKQTNRNKYGSLHHLRQLLLCSWLIINGGPHTANQFELTAYADQHNIGRYTYNVLMLKWSICQMTHSVISQICKKLVLLCKSRYHTAFAIG